MTNSIGLRISEARKEKGMTQTQLADKMFVSTQAVSSWECGNSLPDVDKLPSLAKILGVTTDWLLSSKLPSAEIIEVTSNLSDKLFDENRMATYISAYCTSAHLHQTRKALTYAKEKHDGQYRRPGHSDERVPYIYHPLLLTCHALALGLESDELLCVCLLHDVCEDCGVSPEELPFSDEVKDAVRLLTKPEDFKRTEEYEKAYYDAIAANKIAAMVKLLDRCNNISSMATSFTDVKIAKYIRETKEYVYPLMRTMRTEYPEYSNQLFLIKYHMSSVIEGLRHHMKSAM